MANLRQVGRKLINLDNVNYIDLGEENGSYLGLLQQSIVYGFHW